MKDTLIEIKNNLQGNQSRVDEAENHMNDLEYKEEKDIHNQYSKKKRESEKSRVV